MSGIILNEDSTHYFMTRGGGEYGQLVRQVNEWVDQYEHTAVKEIALNVNCNKTSYDSAVWDPLWKGYDPEQGANQPFFACLKRIDDETESDNLRKLVRSTWQHHQSGVDMFAHSITRARAKGISPWLSMRMNDVHYVEDESHLIHSDFWKNNPQFRRNAASTKGFSSFHEGWPEKAFDYGHREVRDYHFALIEELAERYDFDGLELDWMRFVYHFRPGFESQGIALLTEFTANVRRLFDRWEQVRGHAIKLSARVPSNPQTAYDLGMDAIGWAEQGLVDRLVVTAFWETAETDMPIELWQRLLRGTKTKLAACCEVMLRTYYGDASFLTHSLESARGMAASFLSRGADDIYLYNYFDSLNFSFSPDYPALCREVGSLETLAGKPRRHVLAFHDIVAVGERIASRLPQSCKPGEIQRFRIHTGPKPDASLQAWVILGSERAGGWNEGALTVLVNGEPCRESDACRLLPPVPPDPYAGFRIPPHALHDGYNVIELVATVELQIKWVEIAFL